MAQLTLENLGTTKEEEKKKKKLVPTIPAPQKLPNTQQQVKPEVLPLDSKPEGPTNLVDKPEVSIQTETIKPEAKPETITQEVKATDTKVSSTQEEPGKFDLAKGMAETRKQQKIQALRDMFNQTVASAEQEKADLEPAFRQALGQTMTQDAMQRAAQEKIQATQGLSGAGSRTQTDIAQNVITGGELGALRQQKANLIADINRRINKANLDLQSGIVDANLQSQLEQDQLELARIEEAEQQALQAEQAEREQFLSTLGRFSQDYQAEINRISNDGDPSNDWQIPYLQAARQDEIAGIEAGKLEQAQLEDERAFEIAKIQLEAEIDESMARGDFERARVLQAEKAANDRALQSLRTEGALQQTALKAQFDLNEIVLRDELSNVTQSTEGGLPLDTIEESINNAVGRIPNAEINSLVEQYYSESSDRKAKTIADKIKLLSEQDPNEQVRKLAVMDTIARNDAWFEGVGGDQKLKSVLATNGIDPEAMEQYMIEFLQREQIEDNQFGGF